MKPCSCGGEWNVRSIAFVAPITINLSQWAQRSSCDLDRIAELGIRTLRYPILWNSPRPIQTVRVLEMGDERLNRLRMLQIAPIVGLVHHGSGPCVYVLDR